jgi:hypothetical protein
LALWEGKNFMSLIQEDLAERIKTLEKELRAALEDKERAFHYHRVNGKARFDIETLAQHRKLKFALPSYILNSRFLVVVSAPIIYLGVIPFAMLDIFLTVYQGICFPIYGIPKARRSDYLLFDRGGLKYLNLLERLNCAYCSYANGLSGYLIEIAARTEQHWCPIKHAQRLWSPHSRYSHFFDYGNAEQYRERIDNVRSDFVDLRTLTSSPPKPDGK